MFRNSEKYKKLRAEKNDAKILKIMNRKKNLATLSLGGNISYLFGNIQNTRSSVFNMPSTFNTRAGTTTRFNDIYMDYGLQYAHTIDSINGRDLKDNVKILFGATFAAQTDINAKIDSLGVNYYSSSAGFDIIKDTVEFVEDHKGTVTLPLSFGFGIGFKKGTKWTVAADFAMQNWSSFQAFNENKGLKNSMRVSMGAQYIPNLKAIGTKNYLKRVHYRFGGKYMQSALELRNSQLTEYAVTLGFGFPVAGNYLLRSFSMVNIGVEVGERGTTNNGLVKEQFIKASLGFTINDRWFQKTKFD
jgi:long-subunit fatty acid transport protein